MVFLAQLMAVSERVSIVGAKLGCRDPDDDKILETALMGEADCLITGDRDLLEMSPYCGIPIVAPRDFLDRHHYRSNPQSCTDSTPISSVACPSR